MPRRVFRQCLRFALYLRCRQPLNAEASCATDRILFPVLKRIHWGRGRFCLWALASFCFVRNDLWDYFPHQYNWNVIRCYEPA